jgi:hypothetical protein
MTSRIEWQWQDSGSASGHLQKVVVHEPADPSRKAFGRWLTHGVVCRVCRTDDAHCERGLRLREKYWAAGRTAD